MAGIKKKVLIGFPYFRISPLKKFCVKSVVITTPYVCAMIIFYFSFFFIFLIAIIHGCYGSTKLITIFDIFPLAECRYLFKCDKMLHFFFLLSFTCVFFELEKSSWIFLILIFFSLTSSVLLFFSLYQIIF